MQRKYTEWLKPTNGFQRLDQHNHEEKATLIAAISNPERYLQYIVFFIGS